jgi:hypothetical protein
MDTTLALSRPRENLCPLWGTELDTTLAVRGRVRSYAPCHLPDTPAAAAPDPG